MSDRQRAVEALREEINLLPLSEGTQVTVPLWAAIVAMKALDDMVLTPAEQRAMDASVELAASMRAILGDGWNAENDWAEIARSIHDVQARIVLSAAARFGWTRPLGG